MSELKSDKKGISVVTSGKPKKGAVLEEELFSHEQLLPLFRGISPEVLQSLLGGKRVSIKEAEKIVGKFKGNGGK